MARRTERRNGITSHRLNFLKRISALHPNPMIQCTPRGVCSWDFQLDGGGDQAFTGFDWIGEQGSLVINGENHAVSKHGFFSGQWSLDSNRGTVFNAQKSSAFTRSFEISGSSGSAVLCARSAFGRTMIFQGDGVDCMISPAHAFTRRAVITGSYDDFRRVAFAFWLTALVWRRATRNNSSE
jgi:hypothetical protein